MINVDAWIFEFAFEVKSTDAYHDAVIDKATGEVFVHDDPGGVMKSPPPDADDLERYLPVPSKRNLDLGTPLVRAFVREHMPGDVDTVEDMFRRRGAYRRFKDWLYYRGMEAAWYAYEEAHTAAAIKQWCEEHDVVLVETDP